MRYNIDRTDPPHWFDPAGRDGEAGQAIHEWTGEQIEWGYAIPCVFRILASPTSMQTFPPPPARGRPAVVYTYWESLLHLLLYSLGWARPDRGLRWWYDAGMPTSDPRLALLDQLWRSDGQLDGFAAWLWTGAHLSDIASGLCDVTGHALDTERLQVDERWIDEIADRLDQSGVASPIGGGTDPLHLSLHCGGPARELSTPFSLLRSDREERRAILVLDSMSGWYRALAHAGAKLPPIGDRSWRVEVVVRSVGSLGTFRRSRETDIWFAGRHSLHTRGV